MWGKRDVNVITLEFIIFSDLMIFTCLMFDILFYRFDNLICSAQNRPKIYWFFLHIFTINFLNSFNTSTRFTNITIFTLQSFAFNIINLAEKMSNSRHQHPWSVLNIFSRMRMSTIHTLWKFLNHSTVIGNTAYHLIKSCYSLLNAA